VLTVYIAVAMLFVVAATGAPLKRLAELHIRHVWLLWAALADQILVISVIPDTHPTALAAAHVASYLAAGTCVWLNRHTAGVPLIGFGGGLNGLVISLNGGILPASGAAIDVSGQGERPGHFTNSAVLADPHLTIFGDVLATPAWLPGSNVFSVGDLAIWIGLGWLLWRTCRPRAESRHRRDPAYVGRHAGAAPMSTVG
jgi:hypothetical protein